MLRVSGDRRNGRYADPSEDLLVARKFRHLYGPVPSRRLGRSLGVDLMPHKICTYDCIYCQIGRTTEKTLLRKEYVPVEEVLDEVKRFLEEGKTSADVISLGGSGEPTLHSKIGAVIEGIKKMTSIPVAVITNGSLLYEGGVRQDLLQADRVLPSMDAVTRDVFMRINRPRGEFSVEKMVEGLVAFRKVYRGQIWLEILLCQGVNDTKDELQRMREAVDRINPDRIDLNTVVRPPSETWARPLIQKELEEIQTFFGEKARIILEFDRHPVSISGEEIRGRVLDILSRRPLSLVDLSKWLRIPPAELEVHLGPLVKEGKVKVRPFRDTTYYEASFD